MLSEDQNKTIGKNCYLQRILRKPVYRRINIGARDDGGTEYKNEESHVKHIRMYSLNATSIREA